MGSEAEKYDPFGLTILFSTADSAANNAALLRHGDRLTLAAAEEDGVH